jgi:hypothetical protein
VLFAAQDQGQLTLNNEQHSFGARVRFRPVNATTQQLRKKLSVLSGIS